MLWTDAKSRELIAEHYPWFLPTFDGYKYKIQRADAIRYFVLHRFGGVYMDLDIGCIRPVDSLLKYQVILPKTIPVGVSNDLMFSTKGHPFMEQVIRGLITFDINYILNYPTVMFSTGPMFMSAQYGLYTASHPPTPKNPGGDIRILPKSLYGKNAKPDEAPHTFFEHFYGSSWHSDDAAFITFLGLWGMRLMYVGVVVAIFAVVKMYWFRKKGHGSGLRGRRLMLGRYEVILPRFHYDRDTNSTHLDLGPFSFARHSRESSSSSSLSPTSSAPSSPTLAARFPGSVIPLALDVNLPSPTHSSVASSSPLDSQSVADALRWARSWVATAVTGSSRTPPSRAASPSRRNRTSRRRRPRGLLFFLPAILTPSRLQSADEADAFLLSAVDSDGDRAVRASARSRSRSPIRMTKDEEAQMETVPLIGGSLAPPDTSSRRSSVCSPVAAPVPPPPYTSSRSPTPTPNAAMFGVRPLDGAP